MVFIALSQVFFIALLAGVGRLLWAGFGFETPRNPWLLTWLGFFAASLFTMGYALFLPVGGIPFAVFVLCGLAGMVLVGRDVRRGLMQSARFSYWFWALLLLLFLILDYTTTIRVWGGVEGDTGLYHATLVRWLNEYGIVPGLANLHVRFGNVSSWFSFGSLIEIGPWEGRSAALLPGIGLICGLMYCLYETARGESREGKVYAVLFTIYILILMSRPIRPTLYYDVPALILNGIVVLESLKIMILKKRPMLSQLCVPVFLVAAAFTIKTIPAVSVFAVSMMVFWVLWDNSEVTFRNLLYIFGLPIIVAMFWMSSNIILSAYPFFPLAVFPMPVDWGAPKEALQGAYDDVLGWARLPGSDYRLSLSNGLWFWLKPWLIRVPMSYPSMATLPFILGAIGWVYALWRQRKNPTVLFFFLWMVIGVAYWFITAPDVRFGGGLLWSFFACAAAFSAPDFLIKQTIWIHRGVVLAIAATAIAAVAIVVRTPVWKESAVHWWNIPPMPSNRLNIYEINGGLHPFTVWIPAPESDNQCLNAPLPCTPTPSQDIRLRDPLDMGAGFAPLNPNARRP